MTRLWPILLLLLLGGCERADLSDLERFVIDTKAQSQGKVEPLPEIPPPPVYRYQASGLRDPFQPHRARLQAARPQTGGNGVHPDLDRPREPLENYPLDALTMVGVLRNGGETWAVIRAPDNILYRVRVGNHLGQNHGRITAITDTEVKIVEIVPDGAGGWMERPNALKLAG